MMPYPTPPLSNIAAQHHASNFLTAALFHPTQTPLPYCSDNRCVIHSHLVSLTTSFQTLVPKSSVFTHNDGTQVFLLQADGTIPILYSGAVYNLPVTIWLVENYPCSPPSVFLNPTRDVVIKLNHPYVDRNGNVSIPYLQTWVFPSSNLVDLVSSLSQVFGLDPPLHSRQHIPNYFPSPNPHQEDERRSQDAIKKLVATVQKDMPARRKDAEAETKRLLATHAELTQKEERIAVAVRELIKEKEYLEQKLQELLTNSDVLETWVRENSRRRNRVGNSAVDDVFEFSDLLSRQLVECMVENLAAEDLVYALDKVLQNGKIEFGLYLKSVRNIAREQFFQRAVLAKVSAAEFHHAQAQHNNIAARMQ